MTFILSGIIPIKTVIALIIVIFLIYEYVYKFYARVKLYPRGPMPLPIIGNALMLIRHLDRHPSYLFQALAQKYGDQYTFWLASTPIVLISGISLAKEAFNNYEFCDRSKPSSLASQINNSFFGGHKSFSVMNISDELKSLRTLSVQALRKFLATDKLSTITHEIVAQTVNIIEQNETGNSFDPLKYIESIIIRSITESIYGKKIAFDDGLIEQISKFLHFIQKNLSLIYICDFVPILEYVFSVKKYQTSNDKLNKTFELWYKDMVVMMRSLNNDNKCGNVCEALISALNKSEKIEYTTDTNMIGILTTLIIASGDTSIHTFKWILLFMAYYPEMQQKMRNEINDNIGNNKIADISDKEKCVYVNAFICETLRYRNATPLSVHHMTSNGAKLGDNSIPKQTIVILNQMSILNDSRCWKNPQVFNPERFIDTTEQNIIAADFASFIPFGTGKRMCVGDKFAMNLLFLVLSSLLQATNGKTFTLSDKQNTQLLEPMKFGFFTEAKMYKITLQSIK